MKKQWKFLVLRTLSNLLILGAIFLFGLSLWPTLSSEAWYRWQKLRGVRWEVGGGKEEEFSPFSWLIRQPTPLKLEPVNTDFSLVIEKIGLSAPIVPSVSVTNKKEYQEALKRGIAHAKGTALPGEVGNFYLFAHSSLNFWQLGKYATVFNLLRKLERGERIVVFYKGKRFDYKVAEMEIVKGWDTKPLTRTFLKPAMTLQTCDPPGTTINRLIVTAGLSFPSEGK